MFFSNPWGFLALLAVPALVAIYFLQRKSRTVLTSTLFLLEPAWKESLAGRRFEQFRNSAPFWLQLLAVLLLTWVLAGPRFLRSDSALRVAVVLDSSVSMQASRTETLRALGNRIRSLGALASHIEWTVLESDRRRPTLYSGADLNEAIASFEGWQPWSGTHDPADALRSAMVGAGRDSIIVFVTDRPVVVPDGVTLFSAATAFENVGFTQPQVSSDGWEVWVANSGTTEQRRKWWVEQGESAGRDRPNGPPAGELLVAPGAAVALKGTLESARAVVWLEPDRFTADDTLFVVKPKPKPLRVRVPRPAEFVTRFVGTLDAAQQVADGGDLAVIAYALTNPPFPDKGPVVVYVRDLEPPKRFQSGLIVAESHPLTRNLNWQGLLVPDGFRAPMKEGDVPLVWAGDKAVIFERPTGQGPILCINFDAEQSNIGQHPAFVLMLHRFAEEVRRSLLTPWSGNFELGDELDLPGIDRSRFQLHAGENESVRVAAADLRVPMQPGFFTVTNAGEPFLDGASHFADLREADFRAASPLDTIASTEVRLREEHTMEDHLAPLWVLVALGAMLAGWGRPWTRLT